MPRTDKTLWAGVCVACCPSATFHIIIFVIKIGMIPKMSVLHCATTIKKCKIF